MHIPDRLSGGIAARTAKDVTAKWVQIVRAKRWDMIRVKELRNNGSQWKSSVNPLTSEQQNELLIWAQGGAWDDEWLSLKNGVPNMFLSQQGNEDKLTLWDEGA